MPADPDCLFCKIVAGEIPSTRVDEDERTVAFMDINPATRGHLLVIPREHSTDLLDVPDEDLEACARMARKLAGRAKERLGADGVNLLNSCGRAAWQTVFHFHVHVIPRYANDPLRLPWVPGPGDRDEIAAAAAELTRLKIRLQRRAEPGYVLPVGTGTSRSRSVRRGADPGRDGSRSDLWVPVRSSGSATTRASGSSRPMREAVTSSSTSRA